MRVVIQRVKQAAVHIDQVLQGEIHQGFMILVGVSQEDTMEDVDYLVKKVSEIRLFNDADGKMNLDIFEVKGSILSISQFTLFAETKKGRRPSFIAAAKPDKGLEMYEAFNHGLEAKGLKVATGTFGADMQVSLINDGPVTVMIDSQRR